MIWRFLADMEWASRALQSLAEEDAFSYGARPAAWAGFHGSPNEWAAPIAKHI
jgi:hypothetical protein